MFGTFNITLSSIIMTATAAYFVLSLREWVKARCSSLLGDPTPKKNSGRGPFKFIEPIGFIVTLIFGFGWGRPTPTSPLYYKDRKKGTVITYIMPVLVNLFTGLTAAVVAGVLDVSLGPALTGAHPALIQFVVWGLQTLAIFARVSIATAFFNLIPVPPLDTAKILQTFLPPNAAVKMTQNEKIMQMVLILLMAMGIVGMMINPLTHMLVRAAFNF